MNKLYLILFWVITLILIFIICFVNSNYQKKRESFSWLGNLCVLAAFYIIIIIVSSIITFDNNGNFYILSEETWKYNTYYSKEGDIYKVKCSDKSDEFYCLFYNIKDQNELYKLEDVFVDKSGYIVIDEDKKYRAVNDNVFYNTFYKNDEEGIYINSNGKRIYDITMCKVNYFGEYEYPESDGFYFKEHYFKLYTASKYDEEHNIFINIIGNIENIVFLVSILCCLYYFIKYKGFTGDYKNYLFKVEKAIQFFIISITSLFLMECIKIDSKSLIDSLLRFLIVLIIINALIPYMQGLIQLISDEYNPKRLQLKNLRHISDKHKVKIWMIQQSLLLILYYLIWLMYCLYRSSNILY